MILIDANLLLFAYHAGAPQHERARTWLEQALSGQEPVGLAWLSVLAFLRIGTDPRAFRAPLSTTEALAATAVWFAAAPVVIVDPSARHAEILTSLVEKSQARGPLIMDAHLAALAIEHGAVLHTDDRDFSRFPGLSVRYPLQA